MTKQNRTELIGIRFIKNEKDDINNFISEYNEVNNTDLNLTEFYRTAIFSHIHALQNSDFIIEENTAQNIELQITFLNTLNNFFNKTQKDLKKMVNQLRDNLSLFKGNGNMGLVKSTNQSKTKSNLKI
jgi:hypothetical protein